MRAVLDPNVLISAVISEQGAPAEIMRRWRGGEFELVVSQALITELSRALAYPKLRRLISEARGAALVELIATSGSMAADGGAVPTRSRDSGDDYLIALASSSRAVLVSGDRDLLVLSDRAPIESPRQFLDRLDAI